MCIEVDNIEYDNNVCLIFLSQGGMKAVVWTDTMQVCIMIAGVLAVIIKGSIDVGGIDEVWRRGVEGNRIELLEYIESVYLNKNVTCYYFLIPVFQLRWRWVALR